MQKLSRIAYAELLAEHCLEMTKEKFMASVNNLSLQKHLLGVPTPTMDAVVRAGNEYFQLTAAHAGTWASISRTYQITVGAPRNAAGPPEYQVESIGYIQLATLQKLIKGLMKQMERLARPPPSRGSPGARTNPPGPQCSTCQKTAQFQRM